MTEHGSTGTQGVAAYPCPKCGEELATVFSQKCLECGATEQTNRSRALECSDTGGDERIRMDGIFYAILDLADAVREQTDTQATWLERIAQRLGGP